MLNLLAQSDLPEGMSDVIIVPFILALVGFVIFLAGQKIQNKNGKAVWKWAGLAPIAVGLVMGIIAVVHWMDPIYQAAVATGQQKRMLAAHWGSLLLPLIALGGSLFLHFYSHKLDFGDD